MHFDNKVVVRSDSPIRGEWHPTLLWPNGWMDEDATWYGSRPPRRPHCIRRVPSALRKGYSTPSFRPMSLVATIAHLSYCWALVTWLIIFINNQSLDRFWHANWHHRRLWLNVDDMRKDFAAKPFFFVAIDSQLFCGSLGKYFLVSEFNNADIIIDIVW